MPQFTLSDGSQVDIEVGTAIVRKIDFKATPEEGALTVTGFDTGLPVVQLDGQDAAVSIDTIESVVAVQVPLIPVDLGGGNLINLPQAQADQVKGLIQLNVDLQKELDLLRSGGQVADLLNQVQNLTSSLNDLTQKHQKAVDLIPKLKDAVINIQTEITVLES